MPKPSRRVEIPSLSRFDGFPYLVTRVVPALYHIILLPRRLSDLALRALAREQVLINRLDTCIVLADDHAVYFESDGDSLESDMPPVGGSIVTGRLLPCIDSLSSEELRRRQYRLEDFAAASRARGGYMMGDMTKGGHPATDEELRSLTGTEAGGRPIGLERCARCGGYSGTCLDPGENFRGHVMTVHCACENHNRCARCGAHLYEHRLNANYYDPADRQIWHVPGFCGLSHRCGSRPNTDGLPLCRP